MLKVVLERKGRKLPKLQRTKPQLLNQLMAVVQVLWKIQNYQLQQLKLRYQYRLQRQKLLHTQKEPLQKLLLLLLSSRASTLWYCPDFKGYTSLASLKAQTVWLGFFQLKQKLSSGDPI